MSDRLIGYVNEFTGEASCYDCAARGFPVTAEPLPEHASDTTRAIYDGERISVPYACGNCGAAILGELDADGLRELAEELHAIAEGFAGEELGGIVQHAEAVIRLAGALTRERDRLAKAKAEALRQAPPAPDPIDALDRLLGWFRSVVACPDAMASRELLLAGCPNDLRADIARARAAIAAARGQVPR